MNSTTKCNKLYLIYERYKSNIFLPDLFTQFSRFQLREKVLLNDRKPTAIRNSDMLNNYNKNFTLTLTNKNSKGDFI